MATSEEASNNVDRPRTVQADRQCCGICHELACDPLITDKCCNQIFCSKCLKEYLRDTENDITMRCPCCKTKGFTYAPLDMKVLIVHY